MKTPTSNGEQWMEVESTSSTQNLAAQALRENSPYGVIYAHQQTGGRGRFDRIWVSQEGDSLTFSLIFRAYADHPKPYLVGMTAALAAAGVLHSQLRWPNDLTIGELKLGGILTELLPDHEGRLIPVVGIGINLNQQTFPNEIAEIATSLAMSRGGQYDPQFIAHKIIQRIESLPEPTTWSAIQPIWSLFDHTPGKRYRLATGETAIALGIGSDGQLMCSVDGESQAILAAEALFGDANL